MVRFPQVAILVFVLALMVQRGPADAQRGGPKFLQARILVVPGKSVGPIVPGQPVSDQVAEQWGQGVRQRSLDPENPNSESLVWESGDAGIVAILDEQGRAVRVILSGVRAVTDAGVYIRAPESLVRSRYPQAIRTVKGEGSRVREVTYDVPGLRIEVQDWGRGKPQVAAMEIAPVASP